MEVDLNKWHRCKVDQFEFKKLLEKSDWTGFKHVLIYFRSLLFAGYVAYHVPIFSIDNQGSC